MGVGLGILLLVLGAIFLWVIKVEIPGINQYMLGWIFIGAGALIVILSLIFGAMRGRTTHTERVEGTGARGTRVRETRDDAPDVEM